MDPDLSSRFDECLTRSAQEVLRPGFVRVGVHFTFSEQDLQTLASSVEWVAENGWRILPAYTFDVETGEWTHRLETVQLDRVWLSAVVPPVLRSSPLRALEESVAPKATPAPDDLVAAADDALISSFRGEGAVVSLTSTKCPLLDAEYASLLWFATPMDAAASLRAGGDMPVLAEEGAIFTGESVQRACSSIFSVPKWKSSSKEQEGEASTQVPASPEEAMGTGDADWEPFLGEWGEADDSEVVTNPKRFAFPACAVSPKIYRDLRHPVGAAISEFGMIKEGDRLLIGLSGGKDSLTMLHILLDMQRRAQIKFDIAAATVNPQTPEYNPAPLIDYMEAIGVRYHFLSKPLIDLAKVHLDPKKPSICSFCARMKRGMLYSCMREHGYNVLCLGQHLDDFAESLLMSAFHNGALRTMKANYFVEAHDLRVSRPLVYVRERVMAQFAKENQLPIIQDNCPACFASPKERHRIKLVLSQQEFEHPQLFHSLLKCMKPLISINHTERSLRGTGLLGDADEDEESAPVKGVMEQVLSKATVPESACPDGICGLGSDGACGMGSDDREVAEAGLVAAGEDLARS
jgi:tRNA(Ile)-lysidine synthase TilS/MesJ